MTTQNPGAGPTPLSAGAAVVGREGTFHAAGEVYTLPSDLREMFRNFRSSPTHRLVLHFHGGLTPVGRGLATAQRMLDTYHGVAHPITIVWGTGLNETFDHNVAALTSTEMFKALLDLASKELLANFGLGSGARGPAALDELPGFDAGGDGLDRYEPRVRESASRVVPEDQEDWEKRLVLDLLPAIQADPRLDDARTGVGLPADFAEEPGGRGFDLPLKIALRLAKAVIQVPLRFARGRDHGLRETIFEEVARGVFIADLVTWAWSGMKTRAAEMWLPDTGDHLELDGHVGTALLDAVRDLRNEKPDLTLDLVGHSAGAVAICHLLDELPDAQGLKARNVVFLAPACTVDRFYDAVVSQPDRFDRFRMFALADADECRDAILPGVYGKSLLYLVSGALEHEADELILGLERHTTGEAPYDSPKAKAVHRFLTAPGRTIRAGAGPVDGLRSTAAVHGGFSNDPATLESLRAIVSA